MRLRRVLQKHLSEDGLKRGGEHLSMNASDPLFKEAGEDECSSEVGMGAFGFGERKK